VHVSVLVRFKGGIIVVVLCRYSNRNTALWF